MSRAYPWFDGKCPNDVYSLVDETKGSNSSEHLCFSSLRAKTPRATFTVSNHLISPVFAFHKKTLLCGNRPPKGYFPNRKQFLI